MTVNVLNVVTLGELRELKYFSAPLVPGPLIEAISSKRAVDPATNAWNSSGHYSTIHALPCRTTCRSVPAGVLLELFPHAEKRRSRSQQPEVDRMPSTIESSTNPGSIEGWGTGEKYAADEEEEARLLGRYR